MVNQGMPKNPRVKILPRDKNRICITPLDAQPDPENLKGLKAEIFERWSSTSLFDILKEADLRVGFTDLFQSSRQRETLDRDTLQRRLLLSLYALGTNAGLKRIVAAGHGASYQELRYVRHRFIQKTRCVQRSPELPMRLSLCVCRKYGAKARPPARQTQRNLVRGTKT